MKKLVMIGVSLCTLLGGVMLASNSNIEYKEADASINTNNRFWIIDNSGSYGLKEATSNNITNVALTDLTTPYVFSDTDEANVYTIKNLYSGDYLVCNSGRNLKHYSEGNIPAGYSNRWTVSLDSDTYSIVNADNGHSLYYSSNWAVGTPTGNNGKLKLLSFDSDVVSFVTAMRNISCDDGVTAPAITGDNSWESASTSYSKLLKQSKNYLKYIRTNKDAANTTIEWAMAKYDYIVSKYNKTSTVYAEFVTGREVEKLVFDVISYPVNESKNTFIIVFTVSVTVLFASGAFLYLRKKNK